MVRIRIALVLGALAMTVAVTAGAWLTLEGGAAAGPKRVIYMSAVEHKGSTSSEPFPSATPPPGGGYILKPPDATGKWETSTYRWEPGTIMVNKGEEVELWIWGVNGATHPSHIEEYVPQFTVTRGNLTVLSFTADKVGTFRIHCSAHQPSMEALLVVLPSSTAASPASPTSTSTPAAPAKLPLTGGQPDGGGDWWYIAILAVAGLLSASGVFVLALQRRRC
jgi:plastocyanin